MPADTVTVYKDLLPSFYFDMFKEQDVLESILKAVDLAHLQSQHNQAQEDRTAASIEADPFQTTIAERLTLTKSSRTSILYGQGISYGGSENYGDQDADTLETTYDLGDPEIISIGYIADKVENPTAIYTEGIDFIVDRGLVVFKGALSTYFPDMASSIDENELVQEQGFHLTGYHVRREVKNVYNYFGYAIDYGTPTTHRGKEIFNSVWKLFTFGPSWYYTMRALSLSAGTDVAKSTSESIVANKSTSYATVVITDRNTYICRSDAETRPVDSTLSFGYPVTLDVDVVWDLDRASDTEGGLFVGIGDSDGAPFVYQLNQSTNIDPSGLLLVDISASGSNFVDLKLIDILDDLLPRSTRLVLRSYVQGATAYQTAGSGPAGNVTEITPTAIMTKYTTSLYDPEYRVAQSQPTPRLLVSKR